MKNREFGSILLIIGAGVGAGMLGIPLATAGLGVFLSSLLLAVCWGVTSFTSHLVLHVNLACHKHANFSTMASLTTGKIGHALHWICFLLMFYALIAAYIQGGAALFHESLKLFFHSRISPPVAILFFTTAFGVFVYFGIRSVDYATRFLVLGKMVAIVLAIGLIFHRMTFDHLLSETPLTVNWAQALPVVITAFGYHSVIPTLRTYLHSNVAQLKRSIFLGGLTAGVLYTLWNFVILGILPNLSGQQELSGLIAAVSQKMDAPILGVMIHLFVNIALATSFLSVSMGFFHFICDSFSLKEKYLGHRLLAIILTFLPPMGVAWLYPHGFYVALRYSGLFSVILFMFFPVLMAWRLKKLRIASTYPLRFHWIGCLAALSLGALTVVTFFV